MTYKLVTGPQISSVSANLFYTLPDGRTPALNLGALHSSCKVAKVAWALAVGRAWYLEL